MSLSPDVPSLVLTLLPPLPYLKTLWAHWATRFSKIISPFDGQVISNFNAIYNLNIITCHRD